MSTPSNAARTKAVKLRAKAKVGALTPEEVLWLKDYEDGQERTREARGASRSKKVTYTSEEAEAVGTGSAAEAAAMAMQAREEGKRFDNLQDRLIKGLDVAVSMHERLSATLIRRAEDDGKTIRDLSQMVRDEHLTRVNLEADALRREHEDDGKGGGVDGLADLLLPALAAKLGIQLPAPADDDDEAPPPRRRRSRRKR